MRLIAMVVWFVFSFGLAVASAQPLDELHWYKGNTHTHTINSDGDSSPDVVARWYKEHGYQFLFITDHEYITDASALNAVFGATERFLVLPGQEVTQWGANPKRSSAHVNALFASKIVWPIGTRRCIGGGCGAFADASMPLGKTIEDNIAAIKAEGAVPQINHPNYLWSLRPEDLMNVPNGTLLEIWNGQGSINNLGGDDGAGDIRPSAEGYWDFLLSRGKVIWGVGSDDSHSFAVPDVYDARGAAPGQAWIMVHAPQLTAEAIRNALEHGDFYASTGVTLDDISTVSTGLSLTIHQRSPTGARFVTHFVGKDGQVLATVSGPRPSYHFTGHETYVRAVVIDSNGQHAWTQPVFLDRRLSWR